MSHLRVPKIGLSFLKATSYPHARIRDRQPYEPTFPIYLSRCIAHSLGVLDHIIDQFRRRILEHIERSGNFRIIAFRQLRKHTAGQTRANFVHLSTRVPGYPTKRHKPPAGIMPPECLRQRHAALREKIHALEITPTRTAFEMDKFHPVTVSPPATDRTQQPSKRGGDVELHILKIEGYYSTLHVFPPRLTD
jgi:hypothetical protein